MYVRIQFPVSEAYQYTSTDNKPPNHQQLVEILNVKKNRDK
jgi:hypothetical protein